MGVLLRPLQLLRRRAVLPSDLLPQRLPLRQLQEGLRSGLRRLHLWHLLLLLLLSRQAASLSARRLRRHRPLLLLLRRLPSLAVSPSGRPKSQPLRLLQTGAFHSVAPLLSARSLLYRLVIPSLVCLFMEERGCHRALLFQVRLKFPSLSTTQQKQCTNTQKPTMPMTMTMS